MSEACGKFPGRAGNRVSEGAFPMRRRMGGEPRGDSLKFRFMRRLASDSIWHLREVVMQVREAMTADVQIAAPNQTIQDAARIMAKIDAGACRSATMTGWSASSPTATSRCARWPKGCRHREGARRDE